MAGIKTVEGELVRPYRFGRPSKLTKQLLQTAWDYVEDADNMNTNTLLPTKERLALKLKISNETLYKWIGENKDFSDICKTLDQIQADKLIQNSLVGRYAPGTSAIMLSKHGYVKQEQQDITSGGDKLGADIDAGRLQQLVQARAERTDI